MNSSGGGGLTLRAFKGNYGQISGVGKRKGLEGEEINTQQWRRNPIPTPKRNPEKGKRKFWGVVCWGGGREKQNKNWG